MMPRFALLLWLMMLTPLPGMSAQDDELRLPALAEVARVEISETSAIQWHKAEQLLERLPKFVAAEGTYGSKQPLQRGAFVLKDGRRITWLANGADSILLYAGSNEQLYVLPKPENQHSPGEPLFPVYDADGKEGFIDVTGKFVLPEFEAVGEFNEGLAPIRIGGRWGYIDRAGKVVIQPRWKDNERFAPPVGPFSDGLAAVNESAIWDVRDDSNYWTFNCGYIDRTGEYVIKPAKRQSCGPFSDGLAAIAIDQDGPEDTKSGGWIGYIDAKGNWVIKPKFFQGSAFSQGYAVVSDQMKKDRSGFETRLIDRKGEPALGVKDCRWRYRFAEGLALAYSETEKRYDGYVNDKCEYVFKLPPDVQAEPGLSYFSQGRAAVYQQRRLRPGEISYSTYREKTWGYLDLTGKIAIPFQYHEAQPFSEDYALVGERTLDTYIDREGRVAHKMTIGHGGSFRNGLAYNYLHTYTISERPGSRNIRGYMNKQFKYVWLAPHAETYLTKEWIEQNYVGPKRK